MKTKWLLVAILVIAAILRLYGLTNFPSGLNADEAALGYNAYSIMTTGRDEHGNFLPINLESFGDYKPALYTYVLIPFIKIFGLTEFAVRLPSAIFGILTVWFIYLLTRELLDERIALISSGVLAISPWHLHFSRGAWETNLGTMFILLGVWAMVKWQKNSSILYLLSSIFCFALSMYAYQSARVIAPLLGIGMACIFYKKFLQSIPQVLKAAVVLILLLLPLVVSIVRTDAASRLSGVGWLADEGPLNRVKELRGHYTLANPPIWVKLLYNRPTIYSLQLVYNYLSHFDGNFLFVNGDLIERSKVPETGLLYLTDFILLILGIFYLLKSRSYQLEARVVWLWLGLGGIAAAMTFQVPHALRAHNLVIPITILISCGIYNLGRSLKDSPYRIGRTVLIGVLVIAYSWQIARYLHEYYVHYPKEYPAAWQYGFKELVNYVESQKDKYDKILITDKYDQPYILFLFYSKYDPATFQKNHSLTFRDRFNFSTVRDYDKYHFASTPWEKVRDTHSALIVAAPEDIPNVGVNVVKTINFPSGAPAFKIVSN